MKRPKSDYVIQTVANALRLLEAFRDDEEVGVTELSRRLSLHKNNVFRLLATLEQRGYVEQSSDSERYSLGSRCLELGQSFARTRSLFRLARPILESLSLELSETVHLASLREFEVLHLDEEVPPGLVVAGGRLGLRLPAHCTALGKVLLASAVPKLRQHYDSSVVSQTGLPPRTPMTITDREKFFEHLRAVAGQDFAMDLEECEAGLSCAAAPVFKENGEAVAALSVSGPSFRLTETRLLQYVVPAVQAAAERLSSQLGQSQ